MISSAYQKGFKITMKKLILEMLELQDAMNKQVDIDWINKNREWYRAIWIECGELMEHYGGWKWWKKSQKDLGQILLELVDIWHFGLSSIINQQRNIELATENILKLWDSSNSNQEFYSSVEKLASTALIKKEFSVIDFKSAVSSAGFTFNDIYKGYIGKNILNHFRQANGYKEGTYIKNWNGLEDNVILFEIQNSITSVGQDFKDKLYKSLEAKYKSVTEAD